MVRLIVDGIAHFRIMARNQIWIICFWLHCDIVHGAWIVWLLELLDWIGRIGIIILVYNGPLVKTNPEKIIANQIIPY